MKLVGLMLARNSAWVIGASARSALRWCDALIVLLHACEDETQEIVRQVQREVGAKRLVVLEERNPRWDEMAHRQRTLATARLLRATHVANVDDDEILTDNGIARVLVRVSQQGEARQAASELAPGEVLDMPWISVWRGLDTFRQDASHWSRTIVDVVFALNPEMAYRAPKDGYQHHARRPSGSDGPMQIWGRGEGRHPPVFALGGLMHLQFASERRLLAKQALYKMWEVTRWPGKRTVAEVNAMYDGTALAPDLELADMPPDWWGEQKHLQKHIDLNAEPWQERECKRLYATLGAHTFKGLDLYGVVG